MSMPPLTPTLSPHAGRGSSHRQLAQLWRGLLCATFSFLLLAGAAPLFAAEPDPHYLAELQTAARRAKLADEPYWHRLLHYRANRVLPGYRSTIDAAVFFNAPRGPTDAQAELDATLARFFDAAPVMDEPSQCRFKARYEWLRARLDFDPARLPPQACALHAEWTTNLDTSAIAAVFAANDLNSPATMYGHSLLRLDRRGQGPDDRLLAYAVNYAANIAQGENMLTYTVLGISGGFAGQYSVYRYHEKVRQYARINNRDLWEYPLSLSDDEVQRVLWHLWEMRGVGSEYYFFTENCSYMLLSLLQTAREGLYLTKDFDWPGLYTIPVDTLRVLRDAGMLDAAEFRPSLARRLQHQMRQLDPAQERWVLDASRARIDFDDPRFRDAAPRDRARMLETAHDRLYFRFTEDAVKREQALPATRTLLAARSSIDAASDFTAVPTPATPPERGHETSRLGFGWRHQAEGERDAALLRFRGAYHDRLDPPAGYLAGGELEFFDLGVLLREGEVRLADFELVNVQALAPWDRAFTPMSWQVSGGLRRYGLDALRADPQHAVGAYVDGGLGIAAAPVDAILLYGFAFAEADTNRDLQREHALAAGLRAGFSWHAASRFMQQIETDWVGPIAGAAGNRLSLRLGSQWQFAAQDGLRLNLEYAREAGLEERQLELVWQHYF